MVPVVHDWAELCRIVHRCAVAAGQASGLRIGRIKLETEGGGAMMADKKILLFNETAGCRAGHRTAEFWKTLTPRCEHSTVAEGIRLCDWRWAFVFSGFSWCRVV